MPDDDIVGYRGKWCLKLWRAGKRKRISLGYDATGPKERCPNYPLARKDAEDIKAQIARPASNKIQDFWTSYLDDRQAIRRDRQETSWQSLKWHFGPLSANDITRETCRTYISSRRNQGVSDGTIRKELTDLRAAVNWFDKHNKAVFDLPAPPPPRDRWLTRDEFSRLLEAAENTFHLTVFLHLAIATAGRKEALLTMTWPQVRWDHNEIWLGVKPNGKKRATVPMNKTIKAVLQTAQKNSRSSFVIEYEGAGIQDIKTAYNAAVRRAGLEPEKPWLDPKRHNNPHPTPEELDEYRRRKVDIHTLRHTAGVWMAMAGVDLSKICEYMGHSDIRVTKRVYARFQPDHMNDAAEALEV